MDSPLVWITFLPLVGALLVACVPGVARQRLIALGTSFVVAALGIGLFLVFDGAQAGPQLGTRGGWFTLPATSVSAAIPVSFHLGVDGLSLLLVVLTAVLMPIVLLSSYGHIGERVREFLIWMLVMETGMLGVFASLDLVLFYFFWEVSLVPLYFIVGVWGGERRLYATIKFFLYTLAGSLVMLVGVLALVYALGTTDVPELIARSGELEPGVQRALFLAFALGFAIKVPVVPFHTWLADAHTEAPTSGSVILAGVLLKMGTYGLVRFGIELFPRAAIDFAPAFMALGAIGIVYGALLAMAQTDLKRLVACSSVSHLGFVVLGIFALTGPGLRGGILQMVNHGISTGLLFLLVGVIYERRHTRRIDHFGGIAKTMPLFAFFFVFTVLSSVGLPGLNGFVGEYLILFGAFQAEPFWAVLGVTGVVLGAVYLLSATRRVLFGAIVHDENRSLRDLSAREIGTMLPLCALALWIGVAPGTFIGPTEASIDGLVRRIEDARGDTRVSELELELQEASQR